MNFFHQKGLLDEKYILRYCKGDWESCVRYKKEEAGIYHPDNMRQDGVIDENLI